MSDRDPRVDPRQGDVVEDATNGSRRRVTRRVGNEIDYLVLRETDDPGRRLRRSFEDKRCWITTWRQWCRSHKAVVVMEGTGWA